MSGLRAIASWLCAALVLLACCVPTRAQELAGPPPPAVGEAPASLDSINPVSVLDNATQAVPGFKGGLSGALNIMVLLTVLSLAPALMIMCSCFIRFVIVLSLLKQAIGTQSLPPSQVIVALALVMTFLAMTPTIDRINKEAIAPYQAGSITDQAVLWDRTKQPIRDFMFAQIEATDNWSSVYMILNYRGVDTSNPEKLTRANVDMLTLMPAFMLSELKTSFLLGFRVYLPFLVIDMVIACLLISMSMMMLPPVLISLPFKLLLFVLVDGWQLVVGGLLEGVARGGG